MVEHRTDVREVAGSNPRPDQHSGSLNNLEERAAFVMTPANGYMSRSSRIRTINRRPRPLHLDCYIVSRGR